MDSVQDLPCGRGCPIRKPRDHRSLASPPGFSQRAASFIASQCQGIHQMPLSCSLHPRTAANPAFQKTEIRYQKSDPTSLFSALLAQNLLRDCNLATGLHEDTSLGHGSSAIRRRGHAPRSQLSFLHPSNNLAPKFPQRQSTVFSRAQTANLRFTGSGGDRVRTDALLLAKQALSQLSYTPVFRKQMSENRNQIF
jgi:hypothetical protein